MQSISKRKERNRDAVGEDNHRDPLRQEVTTRFRKSSAAASRSLADGQNEVAQLASARLY